MRNRIAAAALALTSVLSPVYAKAQDSVVSATYPPSSSVYVCDTNQWATLQADISTSTQIGEVVASGCYETPNSNGCRYGQLTAAKWAEGMRTRAPDVVKATFDSQQNVLRLDFNRGGRMEFKNMNPELVSKNLVSTIETCAQ